MAALATSRAAVLVITIIASVLITVVEVSWWATRSALTPPPWGPTPGNYAVHHMQLVYVWSCLELRFGLK